MFERKPCEKKIGFTGTRHGMTAAQKLTAESVLIGLHSDLMVCEFHHGDCLGADNEMYVIANSQGARPISHPPLETGWMGMTSNWETREPKPYLERNRAIVDETSVLIAAPCEMTEQRRGGTWSTVRYAKRQGREIYIVYPDGTAEHIRQLAPETP